MNCDAVIERKWVTMTIRPRTLGVLTGLTLPFAATTALAQEVDQVSAPNQVGVGAAKGIVQQLGAGRGTVNTFNSSLFLIARDPARAIRRGRNLFQRKFKHSEGQGPRTNDGNGPIEQEDPSAPIFENSVGAGMVDSCAGCHARPRGSAGFGGDVFTRPDSRDAPHLFGLGLQEQLADEMTAELRGIRDAAIAQATGGGGGGDDGALTPVQARVLGFENVADWSVATSGTIGVSSTASQGNQSLAVTPNGWTEINSIQLSGLENVATTLSYDIRLPQAAPWGETVAILISPSQGLWWGELGRQQLPGLPVGQFATVSFPIPAAVVTALGNANDVTIKLVINAPALNQPYLLDNLVLTQGGDGGGGGPVTAALVTKGISFGSITVDTNGLVDTTNVQGVNPDLRIRPFFAEGSTVSMREFSVGAFNAEMGIQITDGDINTAAAGGTVVTPSGMLLDGTIDAFETSPLAEPTDPNANEPVAPGLPADAGVALIDFMEFYLLNYFKPGHYQVTNEALLGRAAFNQIGCNTCHQANFTIDSDRRVADVETEFDPVNGVFNNLFATAATLFDIVPDTAPGGLPDQPFLVPSGDPFLVEDIFTDFKRHDLGPELHERNFDTTFQRVFITEPLWGVGSSAPYGHDGRSINLREIILRHGGEAAAQRAAFLALSTQSQNWIFDFLNTLILFPPDDTASNLNVPGDINPDAPEFPQVAHGNIKLPTLFQVAALGPE